MCLYNYNKKERKYKHLTYAEKTMIERWHNKEKKNQKLENSLSKNSSNSSKPSSTDGFHKIVHSLRKKSDKPVGGQTNHDGSTLTKKNVTNIIQKNKGIR